ncbi:MAG: hypothetical protein H5T85_00305 [Actinobacteria bacterium]|nr:hypothetical protein [Actinomycetota bacterium]
MSEQWLKIFLGKIGSFIVSFLVKYYYYLIPLVLAYGIFLTISSYNLKKIEKKVELEIINQAKDLLVRRPDISFVDFVTEIKIPWEDILKKESFFPFVSGESDVWVARATSENICKLIMCDEKHIRNVLERNGILSFEEGNKEKEKGQKNLFLEQIHRLANRDRK